MGSNGGFALLDLETTGFGVSTGDRIVEIGIVLTDSELNVERYWTTLVNPRRDVGPSGVHGIRQEWVNNAPSFLEVAGTIASLLEGRHLVAHNSSFDMGFMRAEFSRTPLKTNIETLDAICSMRLARAVLPMQSRYKLSWLAHSLGIRPSDHTALGDALTTLELFKKLRDDFPYAFEPLASRPVFLAQPHSTPSSRTLVRPEEIRENREGLLQEIRNQLPLRTGLTAGVLEYLETLDESLFDNHLSADEIRNLISLAKFWGLGAEEITKAHDEYFSLLLEKCWDDGRLTPSEFQMLNIRAEWLGIEIDVLENGLRGKDAHGAIDLPFGLRRGDMVCLTGDMNPPKAVVSDLLTRNGITVKSNVSSKTNLLVAAQLNTMSGKAQRARELGIPIVAAADLSKAFLDLTSD